MPKAENEKKKRGRTAKAGPKTGEAPLPSANGSAKQGNKTPAKKRVTGTVNSGVRRALGRVHATGEALFPAPPPKAELPTGYAEPLDELKTRIRQARLRTVLAANTALIQLYWDLGRTILTKQSRDGWGAKVVDRFAHDLRAEFPDMNGLSPRNLLFMRSFAEAYPDAEIVKQLVSQLPWGHVIKLLQRVKKVEVRHWYMKQAIEHGWSRSVLDFQIDRRLHERQGRLQNNFASTLPPATSDMATQISGRVARLALTRRPGTCARERINVRLAKRLGGSGFGQVGPGAEVQRSKGAPVDPK